MCSLRSYGSLGLARGQYQYDSVNVSVTSLDLWRKAEGLQDEQIFLLKVDAEGKDSEVLAGAKDAFGRGKIKMVLWEVGEFYFTAADDMTKV